MKNNSSFKKKFSTAHAIVSLIENIEKEIDNNSFVCGTFIGLQNALTMYIMTYCFINFLSMEKEIHPIVGFLTTCLIENSLS